MARHRGYYFQANIGCRVQSGPPVVGKWYCRSIKCSSFLWGQVASAKCLKGLLNVNSLRNMLNPCKVSKYTLFSGLTPTERMTSYSCEDPDSGLNYPWICYVCSPRVLTLAQTRLSSSYLENRLGVLALPLDPSSIPKTYPCCSIWHALLGNICKN